MNEFNLTSSEAKKDFVASFLHFEVKGMALIRDWYGNVGSVEMKPYTVKNWSDAGEGINDGGFGAQEILGAKLHVYAVYGPKETFMFPGFSPLKIETDVYFISLDPDYPRLENAERVFLDETDTSVGMHQMDRGFYRNVDKNMKDL